MNSLGGGGDEAPYLVNAANALTFSLMVLSCYLSSIIVRMIGIKNTLIIGTMGYAPYAAGLYTHNRYGTEWLILFGAALCGLGAGIFWMAEAAVALAYPEPYNQGRFLGLWLSFRVGGQILGGAVNLGVNARRNGEGKVSYHVFEVFIALQALAPFVGLLLSAPRRVQRSDGVLVNLGVRHSPWYEIKATTKMFFTRHFLLIVPLIWQAVYAEAVAFTYQSLWFSVRARALGSFLSGVIALVVGNVLGAFIDNKRVSLKTRSRVSFLVVLALQGGWWIWGTVVTTQFRNSRPVYDWVDPGFGKGFALYLFWIIGFQLNYMLLYENDTLHRGCWTRLTMEQHNRYFIVGNLADDEEEVVRIAGLLRGTESAAQAVSVSCVQMYSPKSAPDKFADMCNSTVLAVSASWPMPETYMLTSASGEYPCFLRGL